MYNPVPHDLEGAIWATMSMVAVAILLLLGIAGCFARLICALQPEKEETAEEAATSTSEPAAPAEEGGLPTVSKLAHVLSAFVAGVIALAVATVLADGTSVIRLKNPKYLSVITNPDLKNSGFDHRLDELLGPSYGIGLHHDQSGKSWIEKSAEKTASQLVADLGIPVIAAALPSVIATDDLKHPVPFLECKNLQTAGLAAMGFGFIAESVAILMVAFHAIVLAGLLPSSKAKPLAALIWAVLSAGFLIVVCLAVGIYLATWKCDNIIIPEISLWQHFDYNYGFAFAIVGYVSSVLILNVTLFATSMKDVGAKFSSVGGVLAKIIGGVIVGAIIGMTATLITMGSNGYFIEKQPADININPCEAAKPYNALGLAHYGAGDKYFKDTQCTQTMQNEVIAQTLEQAGANVTRGYKGLLDAADRVPILESYDEAGLCPVNVHWHMGAEHLSVGQFDEKGHGPYGPFGNETGKSDDDHHRRQLASKQARLGFRCHHYDDHDTTGKFDDTYVWEYCKDMHVGETYEIHWPHSAAGACGTKWQYQYPFYDGVFCHDAIITIAPLNTYEKIGVQSQVFTVINTEGMEAGEAESYYYPDLISGMIVGGDFGADMAKYTGSTTGTKRDNEVCSRFTPITWQVDRKCHMISASSFDKLCRDMLAQADDMAGDIYPHGSREVVDSRFVANNQQSRE